MALFRYVGAASIVLLGATGLGFAQTPAGEEPVAEAMFTCNDDKSIKATFYADKVDLTLSDGRAVELPQTISGSGARYATADDSLVFWNKGNTAFITEGDPNKPTYDGCVTEPQTDDTTAK